jgi:hypothetical protein
MSHGIYLGKEFDPKTEALGARLDLDPSDLLTHGLIVGMTGSGKTGLAIALIEEVLRQSVPVLAIDPKGDLCNLLLLFDDLSPTSFQPWLDADAVRREGKEAAVAAAEAAAGWSAGLADWGLSASDITALKKSHDAVIYTPGSQAGIPLNVLQSLEAPRGSFDAAAEDLRDEIAGIVSGILGLLGIDADPLQSREFILLSNLIEVAWRKGQSLTLEGLITAVSDPPFDKIGALPLESVYPKRERQGFMLALNNLLASPGFAAWREGEPLDVARLLRAPDGRPRLSIVYTAHLSDPERLFITALLLDKVKTWMRQQGGTTELRALVYMDEIYGYFPPHPADPPTKRPLLTLLKQARAQGVGVVLATQNPVDLDYKGLANMGIWLVGKLQTERDRARLQDGLLGSGVDANTLDELLGATRKRVFLLHDIHRPAPVLVHSRCAMSYLRGPLTRDEIEGLMDGRQPEASSARPSATPLSVGAPASAAAVAPVGAGAPPLPPPFRHQYFAKYGGALAEPHLLVKYAVRYKKAGEGQGLRAYCMTDEPLSELLESEPVPVEEDRLEAEAPVGLRHRELPPSFVSGGAKGVERVLKDRLADKLEATFFFDPLTETYSQPGEDADAFAARLLSAGPGKEEAKLREKLERKKRELAMAEQELSGRKAETWMAVGSAILSNIGLLTGGRRRISLYGASSAMSRNRMENSVEARVEALKAEVAELDQQVTALMVVEPSRFEEKTLEPSRSDVSILRYDVVWIY